MQNDRIAYCGVDCAACADFHGGKCPGCRQTKWNEKNICMPVDCCRKKQYGECAAFVCEDMRAFYEESATHKQAFARMQQMQKTKKTGEK